MDMRHSFSMVFWFTVYVIIFMLIYLLHIASFLKRVILLTKYKVLCVWYDWGYTFMHSKRFKRYHNVFQRYLSIKFVKKVRPSDSQEPKLERAISTSRMAVLIKTIQTPQSIYPRMSKYFICTKKESHIFVPNMRIFNLVNQTRLSYQTIAKGLERKSKVFDYPNTRYKVYSLLLFSWIVIYEKAEMPIIGLRNQNANEY